MVRIKRGITSIKKRRTILKKTKGYRNGRSTKERQAKEAMLHAGQYAFAHRRKKKGDFRKLWNTRLSAGLAPMGVSYSVFISLLKKNNVLLNRKVLSEIADKNPDTFKKIVEKVNS